MSSRRYLPCELHCHSVHSDGSFEVPELLRAGLGKGLSLLALTDHNTASGCAELTEELVAKTLPAVPGIEWTTDYGHLLVLGAREYVDWRSARPDNIDEKLAEIRAAGGVCGIAHPFRAGFPVCCGCRFEFRPTRFDLVDFLEIWSGPSPQARAYNLEAIAWWTELLDRGFRIAAAYGRDWHGRSKEARPAPRTFLGFAGGLPTVEGALDAIRGARTIASLGPAVTFSLERGGSRAEIGDRVGWLDGASALELSFELNIENVAPARDRALGIAARSAALVGSGGRILWEGPVPDGASGGAREAGSPPTVSGSLRCDSPYLRLVLRGELDGASCDLALTSPIWLASP